MIINGLVTFVNFLISSIGSFIRLLVGLLPDSPFLIVESFALDYIDTLNWFMPITFMINLLAYWVLAIGIYYLIQIPLRFTKVVE